MMGLETNRNKNARKGTTMLGKLAQTLLALHIWAWLSQGGKGCSRHLFFGVPVYSRCYS